MDLDALMIHQIWFETDRGIFSYEYLQCVDGDTNECPAAPLEIISQLDLIDLIRFQTINKISKAAVIS